jgi:hypothetical protein
MNQIVGKSTKSWKSVSEWLAGSISFSQNFNGPKDFDNYHKMVQLYFLGANRASPNIG